MRRALLALLALFGASEACAHAALVATIPADGAALEATPAEIILRFNEPVTPLVVRLRAASGSIVALPAAAAHGEEIRIPAPAEMRDGAFVLSFRVTSLDSHPVSGSIQFSIGTATIDAATTANAGSIWEWAVAAIRVLHYCALLVAAGGALFVLLVASFRGDNKLLVSAALVAAITALAAVGLQGAVLLDTEPGEVMAATVWRAGWQSTRGTSAIVAIAGLALIGAGIAGRGLIRKSLLPLGALIALASVLVTGHAATAQPRALSTAAHLNHVFAAAYWSGSLVALLLIFRAQSRSDVLAPLRRFSSIALVAVPLLIAAAIALAALRLPSVDALLDSRYGNLVVAKAALLLVLLGLAALNRWRFTPRFADGDAHAGQLLRRSIRIEVAVMLGVLTATALLAQTPPPRAAPAMEHSWSTIRHSGDHEVELIVAPAHPGTNALVAKFRDKTGASFDPHEVSFEIANEAAGVEPIARRPRRIALGEYRLDGVPLSVSGKWSIRIDVRVSDFDKVIFRVDVPVH